MPAVAVGRTELTARPAVAWQDARGMPQDAAAVLDALRFDQPATPVPLGVQDWERTLAFCDRAHLTLLVGAVLHERLPGAVAERIARNRAGNEARRRRLLAELLGIADRLSGAGIEYLALKGFTHGAAWTPEPGARPQYDLDLFAPQGHLDRAQEAILGLGFEAVPGMETFPTDHLPVMVRKTGWQWRGDLYDPDIPPAVDLHFRFWDPATERIEAPGTEAFWERRTARTIGGAAIPVLSPADDVGYSALHVARHLLRGRVQPYHVYEIAYFLDRHAPDAALWETWWDTHPEALRRVEALAFELARRWFRCRVAPRVEEEAARLGGAVHEWMARFAARPAEGMFRPNKSELWLHLALLEEAKDRRAIVRRRVLPLRPPGPVDGVFVPADRVTWRIRLRKGFRYLAFASQRAVHHARALLPVATEGLTWYGERAGLREGFVPLLLAANLYNFGIFVFFLLYNLYLLDLGFQEDLLGQVTASMTLGTIAASLPAAMLARKWSLAAALRAGCAGAAGLCALRALAASRAALLGTAFLGGAAAAVWFVSVTAAVARLSAADKRPLGYSLWIGTGIATGVLGGLFGGWLPGRLLALGIVSAPVSAKSAAILAGCGFVLLALLPLARVRLPAAAPAETKVYPRGPAVTRFLIAFSIWQFAIGAFNPFFNAFFSRHGKIALEQIGTLFAVSQAVQAAAVLMVPLILRRAGSSGLQTATAVALLALAAGPPTLWAAGAYVSYMCFQVMTEPGLFSLLMNRVRPVEQGGAAALLFFVISGAQAAAALAAGEAIAAAGYAPVLAAAALLALLSAGLFRKIEVALKASPLPALRPPSASD